VKQLCEHVFFALFEQGRSDLVRLEPAVEKRQPIRCRKTTEKARRLDAGEGAEGEIDRRKGGGGRQYVVTGVIKFPIFGGNLKQYKTYKSMVILRDFPYSNAVLGLIM